MLFLIRGEAKKPEKGVLYIRVWKSVGRQTFFRLSGDIVEKTLAHQGHLANLCTVADLQAVEVEPGGNRLPTIIAGVPYQFVYSGILPGVQQ